MSDGNEVLTVDSPLGPRASMRRIASAAQKCNRVKSWGGVGTLIYLALTNDFVPQKTYTFYFGKCQRYCIVLFKASTNATGIAITRIIKRGVATCFRIMLAIRAFLLVTKAATFQLYVHCMYNRIL
jgi:hypothetical protein